MSRREENRNSEPVDRAGEPASGLPARFLAAMRSLIPASRRSGPWIVALSGGCDSTALLRLLEKAAGLDPGAVPPPSRITAAHVHHGLRGREADADEEFSRNLAARFGFGFCSRCLSPPPGLPQGAVENWARSGRYRVLREAALARGASLILTGHNRNDQAETVLQRFIRGAGFWGLASIRPLRPVALGSPMLLARPLLAFTRREIAAYLDVLCQPHAVDATNEEMGFQRNRIRRHLMPHLERSTPGTAVDDLCRIAELSQDLHETLDRAARSAFQRVVREEPVTPSGDRRMTIPVAAFRALADPLRYALLRFASLRLAPRQVPLSQRVFQAAVDTISELSHEPMKKSVSSWSVAPDLSLTVSSDTIQLSASRERNPDPGGKPPSPFEAALSVPGEIRLPDGSSLTAVPCEDRAETDRLLARKQESRSRHLVEAVDGEKLGTSLLVRFRRPGDLFHPLGASGRRKLKSFLIDEKIPRADRDTIPLVVAGKKIAWAAGVRLGHDFRITGRTGSVVLLSWNRT